MSFSAKWLALRAPADDRARDPALAARAARLATRDGEPARIVDLGSGTGATLRALSPHIAGPQHWTLVDADTALLAEAERLAAAAAAPNITVETRNADLAATPAPWSEPPALVTASALFDLTSAHWLERFADALAKDAIALYTVLTFDGALWLSPAHPFDGPMVDAFHAHQRTDKGFGPAAGPDAGRILAGLLAARGYRVELASTPWQLTANRDAQCMAAMLDGWAGAATQSLQSPEPVRNWRDFHRSADHIVVGHVDILATPSA